MTDSDDEPPDDNAPASAPSLVDPWHGLRRHTPARIALGRSGVSLPTLEVLAFGLAHAKARDAVHQPLDLDALGASLRRLGHEPLMAASRATSRDIYLRRPDLGRSLREEDRAALAAKAGDHEIAIIVADGLSARAVQDHAEAFLSALLPAMARFRLAPIVVASGARVALGDPIGEALGARLVLMLIGERPGLSSPDSMGAYLTFGPRSGRTDAERNCVSNIRPEGLKPDEAAKTVAWLIREALRREVTGIGLKDDSHGLIAPG